MLKYKPYHEGHGEGYRSCQIQFSENTSGLPSFGESHGAAVGAVIDGCPAGLAISEDDIQPALDRRAPGKSAFSTSRQEPDQARILSGVFEGKTTGTPIAVLIENKDQRSKDYSDIANLYRPGHADYTYEQKYGIRDYRGGGRSSGRETIARVIGGAIAEKLLGEFGIHFTAYADRIGTFSVPEDQFNLSAVADNPLCLPASDTSEAEDIIRRAMEEGDSVGGSITCLIDGCPAGLGDPVFGKLDALLSYAVMGIGAVKGVEIGDGILSSYLKGSENNDPFEAGEGGVIRKISNHSGGILGGISDGSRIILRAAVKPTPSISIPQHTADASGHNRNVCIGGRHDPCIVPRAVVVVEAMCAMALADAFLGNAAARVDYLHRIYD